MHEYNYMADARDTFHAVKSMSILCLWDIQLIFDRNGVGTYGAYHHKSELKRITRDTIVLSVRFEMAFFPLKIVLFES